MTIFNFELGEKLDQYFDVKFYEESKFEAGGTLCLRHALRFATDFILSLENL